MVFSRPGFLRLASVVSMALAACSSPGAPVEQGEPADEMLRRHAVQVMKMRPSNATYLGLGDADLDTRINDRMDDYSRRHMIQWRRALMQMRGELRALEPGELDPLTRAALDEIYGVYLGASNIPFGFIDRAGRHRPYVINQIEHPLQDIPMVMATFQKIADQEDAADYLRRMWAFSPLVDSVLSKFNADADAGWIAPRPLLEGALSFLEDFTSLPPAEHPLVTHLEEQLNASDKFDADQRARILNEARALIVRVIYPAYQNAAWTVRDRLPEARAEAGIWAQPLGGKFYLHSIAHEALSDKSPEQIHQLGLSEVERVLNELDQLLRRRGYDEGSVGERMRQLAAEERFLYEDSAAGRQQLLADLNRAVEAMQARLPDHFGTLPEQGVEIRRIPQSRQAGAPGGQYDGPSADGSRRGIFWINLRDMEDLPRFRLPTLTYHETVPGHHLQVALARAQSGRPMLWRFTRNSAYSEGWALYAERLAAEMGVYREDPYGDLGRLQAELFRAVRLVVDTGLHHKRWSRRQAIDYMMARTGRGEVDVTAEVERYMAWPGQALAYKLGMLEILDMRAEAMAGLGGRFDLTDFHDTLLRVGPVSMPLLREQMQVWSEESLAE